MVMTRSLSLSLVVVLGTVQWPVRASADGTAGAILRPGGTVPSDATGRPLNLDFEKGTLADWKAEGSAFDGQPVEGDTVSRRRRDMHMPTQAGSGPEPMNAAETPP